MIILNFFIILARLVFLFLTVGLLLFGRKNANFKINVIICFLLFVSTFSKILWIIFIGAGAVVLISAIAVGEFN